MSSVCKHQGISSKAVDKNKDLSCVWCYKHKDKCICQRYCGKLNQYIISEQAIKYCKDYEAL